MAGPARAGLFVYASDMGRVARFYESVAGMRRLHQSDELVVLQSADIQLLVHRIPPHVARDIVVTTPPRRREDTALKFFLTVPSLDDARSVAAALGGEVFDGHWRGPGFVACNAMDPEGNVLQLRESLD